MKIKAARRKLPAKRSPEKVQPIPAGYSAVTPYLAVRGAAQAIEFYKKAFGAKEMRMLMQQVSAQVGVPIVVEMAATSLSECPRPIEFHRQRVPD